MHQKLILHRIQFVIWILISTSADDLFNEAGGTYSGNHTLYYRDGPFKATRHIQVLKQAFLTIEQGVKIYFDPGVGVEVAGILNVAGDYLTRVQFAPRLMPNDNQHERAKWPNFRLIDGPSTSKGRLQILHNNLWRSVCTMNTNWTATDYSTACRSMGFGSGGFWRWLKRHNETRPFAMPQPGCPSGALSLYLCSNFTANRFMLSEYLCSGNDDLGLSCWGPPTFKGQQFHWKGIKFVDAPWKVVITDPDKMIWQKRSMSSLQHLDLLYGGYDNDTRNTTAVLTVLGNPPVMNSLNIQYSAGDGVCVLDSDSPTEITNSTILYNRGHGIIVENSADRRLFINATRIQFNYGNGIQYLAGHNAKQFDLRKSSGSKPVTGLDLLESRLDACIEHESLKFTYPQLVEMHWKNAGLKILKKDDFVCFVKFRLPASYPYDYTIELLKISSSNPLDSHKLSHLYICDTGAETCQEKYRYKFPLLRNIILPSVEAKNTEHGLFIGLKPANLTDRQLDISVVFKVFAGPPVYGLNLSNSVVESNIGHGVHVSNTKDRTVITNVTLKHNQGMGLKVSGGVGDLWINNSVIEYNFDDGINVTHAGGSTVINGTSLSHNRNRGIAFHFESAGKFLPIKQEIVIKGKPTIGPEYKNTAINNNSWGGIFVGNFCSNSIYFIKDPRIIINFVQLIANQRRPAFEYHACTKMEQPMTLVQISGSSCQKSTALCIKVQPAVNIVLHIHDNNFYHNSRGVLLIQNGEEASFSRLPAEIYVLRNQFKFNSGRFVLNMGLNEGSVLQHALITDQNEIRQNRIEKPYPNLNPRSVPHGALIVSSSNVEVHRNCFNNPDAEYEIATDLKASKAVGAINATENNWGSSGSGADFDKFMKKIFDNFKRYTLAHIEVDPVTAVCNAQAPRLTPLNNYFRKFRDSINPFVLGGSIYEPVELARGVYKIVDDLQVSPGASLTLQPGTVFRFANGLGLLVQGEFIRSRNSELDVANGLTASGSFHGFSRAFDADPVVFTDLDPIEGPITNRIRLVDPDTEKLGSLTEDSVQGRLEINLADEWGTICNRRWTWDLALRACNTMGLTLDKEYKERWYFELTASNLTAIIMDNIRCDAWETDLTRCQYDSVAENIDLSCSGIVGLRCIRPHWTGVRYSLLANPPLVTGQSNMYNWIIEKAGLLDSYSATPCAALQIDWNHHVFHNLTIKESQWDGVEIFRNDFIRKPRIYNAMIVDNKRNGLVVRSVGLSMENVTISRNREAGLLYDPIVDKEKQMDISSRLRMQPWSPVSNIITISNNELYQNKENKMEINLTPSLRDQLKFLVFSTTVNIESSKKGREEASFKLKVSSRSLQTGLTGRIGVQIVNQPDLFSDENLVFTDQTGFNLSLKHSLLDFPIVSNYDSLEIEYSKSFGLSKLIVLLFFLDNNQRVDPFIHLRYGTIENNLYGFAARHYNEPKRTDESSLNRHRREQLWLQQSRLSMNHLAVLWIHSPDSYVKGDSDVVQNEYWIDNCTISSNTGGIVQTHRDSYASSNVFRWRIYRNNIHHNNMTAFSIYFPNQAIGQKKNSVKHSVEFIENNVYDNFQLNVKFDGFYAWLNISSNNFSTNEAQPEKCLLEIFGAEKELILERNRFQRNKAKCVIASNIKSHWINGDSYFTVPSRIFFNYFLQNYYPTTEGLKIHHWPRSYAIGMFGLQKLNISFNNIHNPLLDFEFVAGLKCSKPMEEVNVTYNYWGPSSRADIASKIFDFDKCCSCALAIYSPYLVSWEPSISFEWKPSDAQIDSVPYVEPDIDDLKGRLFRPITLSRRRQKWPNYPWFYKPDVPYRIRHDLTIMPEATLTVEQGVEVHVCPGVRILVLGNLVVQGSPMEPVRFLPVNITEFSATCWPSLNRNKVPHDLHIDYKSTEKLTRATRTINNEFLNAHWSEIGISQLYHEIPRYWKDTVLLLGSSQNISGFLHLYNETAGEITPICDALFTNLNAKVVCRELGYDTSSLYFWVGPWYDFDPKLKAPLRTGGYPASRQCLGDETRFSDCPRRYFSNSSDGQCIDVFTFVFVHCDDVPNLDPKYVDHWGGVTFGSQTLDFPNKLPKTTWNHVEIVGAGKTNDRAVAAITLINRLIILDRVNVTNSTSDGIQIINAAEKIEFKKINITHNKGIGLNILSAGSIDQLSNHAQNKGINDFDQNADFYAFPNELYGWLGMCSLDKAVEVSSHILLYHKYDGNSVECVKYFYPKNAGRPVQFRILKLRLPATSDSRLDHLTFYDGRISETNKLGIISGNDVATANRLIRSTTGLLIIHFRGNAASWKYGFLAEISLKPAVIDSEVISIMDSRFDSNDRGAVSYMDVGMKATFIINRCFFGHNGYGVWGNYSTTESAVKLDLTSTSFVKISWSSFWHNQGGLNILTDTQPPLSAQGVLEYCSFGKNANTETLKVSGRSHEKFYSLRNYFGKNYCPYKDVVFVNNSAINMTLNAFYNNTGAHILHCGRDRTAFGDYQLFYNNVYYDNLALGHGYHFSGLKYGYFPDVGDTYRSKFDLGHFETAKIYQFERENERRKREFIDYESNDQSALLSTNQKASYEWFSRIGDNVERYRSTILAGSNQQQYAWNYFHNPLNSFELTSINKSISGFDGKVDARNNYWGYPGNLAVAQGRIRDEEDYAYLQKVDYRPVLETNTSVIEGFCPPGWLHIESTEWRSVHACFLFIPGVMTYKNAIEFCKEQDASMPYMQDNDKRLKDLASKLQIFIDKTASTNFIDSSRAVARDVLVWISGTNIPLDQCGALSSLTGLIIFYNCEDLLPFVCEKGSERYEEHVVLQSNDIYALAIVFVILMLIVCLLLLWYLKSVRRKKEFFERKSSLRSSIRSNKASLLAKIKQKQEREPSKAIKSYNDLTNSMNKSDEMLKKTERAPPGSPDLVLQAYRNLVFGGNSHSLGRSSENSFSTNPPGCPSISCKLPSGSQCKDSVENYQETSGSEIVACKLNSLTNRNSNRKTSSRKKLANQINHFDSSPATDGSEKSPTTSISDLLDNSPPKYKKIPKKTSASPLASFKASPIRSNVSFDSLLKNKGQSSMQSSQCSVCLENSECQLCSPKCSIRSSTLTENSATSSSSCCCAKTDLPQNNNRISSCSSILSSSCCDCSRQISFDPDPRTRKRHGNGFDINSDCGTKNGDNFRNLPFTNKRPLNNVVANETIKQNRKIDSNDSASTNHWTPPHLRSFSRASTSLLDNTTNATDDAEKSLKRREPMETAM